MMIISRERPISASVLPGFAKAAGFAVMMATASLLASCGTARTDRTTTNSIPDDYRSRHPITLAEVEHNLDVPLGAGEHGLTTATRDLIKGFAQDYTALSKSTVRIAIPANAANSGAADKLKGAIRKALMAYGIPAARIVQTNYDPQTSEASAPVRLTFVAVTAITDECGQWPSDLVAGHSTIDNTNWENFGCATQQNLAAQIANPADLVGPRGMTPIDAQRRAEVIRVYRDGS